MKYRTAQEYMARINRDAFGNLIKLPRLAFTRNRNIYGETDNTTISVNPNQHIDKGIETIYHELLHVFIDTILESPDDDEHGVIFRAWYHRLIPDYVTEDLD